MDVCMNSHLLSTRCSHAAGNDATEANQQTTAEEADVVKNNKASEKPACDKSKVRSLIEKQVERQGHRLKAQVLKASQACHDVLETSKNVARHVKALSKHSLLGEGAAEVMMLGCREEWLQQAVQEEVAKVACVVCVWV